MTVTHAEPTKTETARMIAQIQEERDLGGDKTRLQNYLFAAIYNRTTGFYGRDNGKPANTWRRGPKGLVRIKNRMTRREWIEKFFRIVPMQETTAHTIKLNYAQRKLEATILRMERAGVPVRIQILKSRKQGCSTYVQAVAFYQVLTGTNEEAVFIGDTRDRSEILIAIMRTALQALPRTDEHQWEFYYRRKRVERYEWGAPIDGKMSVTSAEAEEPARGSTPRVCHWSESAFWKDPEKKQRGIMNAVPEFAGTYVFDESTANGDQGAFRDSWYRYSSQQEVPYQERIDAWATIFFSWFEHPNYRLTHTGRTLTETMKQDILATLDEEERWLLKQRYYVRGRGWCQVDLDQLAWRRLRKREKGTAGDDANFDEEYPSRPEVAFRATGAQVFDADTLARYSRACKPPLWRGTIERVEKPEPAADA